VFVAEQFRENLGAEEFFQNPMRDFWSRMPGALFVQQAIRCRGVNVGIQTQQYVK